MWIYFDNASNTLTSALSFLTLKSETNSTTSEDLDFCGLFTQVVVLSGARRVEGEDAELKGTP